MFVLSKDKKYFWPVKLELPKNGGQFDKVSFEAEFKQIPQSRIKEVFNPENVSEVVKDNDFIKEVMVGWKGVVDKDNNEIPFTQSNLEEMLEIPSLSRMIVTSFLESIAGSKIKN